MAHALNGRLVWRGTGGVLDGGCRGEQEACTPASSRAFPSSAVESRRFLSATSPGNERVGARVRCSTCCCGGGGFVSCSSFAPKRDVTKSAVIHNQTVSVVVDLFVCFSTGVVWGFFFTFVCFVD